MYRNHFSVFFFVSVQLVLFHVICTFDYSYGYANWLPSLKYNKKH